MKSFWQDLSAQKKPFLALAPMEGAIDTVFRQIVSLTGRPDVYFTEFTNVEGLFSKGTRAVERRLIYTNIESPIIAQIWGLNPGLFQQAAGYLARKGFDGIDINMGCPDSSVTSRGACAGLINNKQLAKEIIQAVKEGAESHVVGRARLRSASWRRDRGGISREIASTGTTRGKQNELPVSVKTRIGFSAIQTEEWIGFLLEQDLDALIIHGRTRQEMSKVPAHWDEIGIAVKLRNSMKKQTVIIGNGDVKNLQEAENLSYKYGVEGIMIGRGVFENAWVFSPNADFIPSASDRKHLLMKHLELYDNEKGSKLPFQTLKKYFKIYIRNFDGASDLRMKLMETKTIDEVKEIISVIT